VTSGASARRAAVRSETRPSAFEYHKSDRLVTQDWVFGIDTRISTASSATNMRSSALEYPTSGWVNFQSATLGQFCIGGYSVTQLTAIERISPSQAGLPPRFSRDAVGVPNAFQ
jgi:hypothetical protein